MASIGAGRFEPIDSASWELLGVIGEVLRGASPDPAKGQVRAYAVGSLVREMMRKGDVLQGDAILCAEMLRDAFLRSAT